jgi:hypothetical protein
MMNIYGKVTVIRLHNQNSAKQPRFGGTLNGQTAARLINCCVKPWRIVLKNNGSGFQLYNVI